MVTNASLPVHLQIEPTQRCNLSCVGCSINDVHRGKKRSMLSSEDFEALLSNAPSVQDISLHGLGEPFLNDELDRIAALLGQRGIVARTLTNGNVINSRIENRVLLGNLSEICFSIDGDNGETDESIRRGASFDKFKRVVSSFSELRARENTLSCELSFNCVISKMNVNNVSGIPELASNLGIDRISFNFISHFYYSENDRQYDKVQELRMLEQKKFEVLIDELEEKCATLCLGISYPDIGKKRHLDCFWPKRGAFVTAEGYVTPCNYRMNPKILSFGNLLTHTMQEIWHSEGYAKFRESFLRGEYYDFCLTCS
jgi:MoaA/NifB/PqqE/SkfB family radical SAM enzyme